MSDETAHESLPEDAHADAAAAFVERARSRHGDELAELYVFGSTVRGEARGRASDVDVLVVLDDDADRDATADSLRDIALDAMIEYGPVVELHILSESTFERHRREGNPFIRNVVTEGRSYA
ncbi:MULTISPECIES: nucleotidyltransferase domain-containing protein [Halorussus]|uniref:nucleotidyltransferase domain-containing protein n=1 Tax=Halorussus TaxID=1070314 RepID=UPI00209DC70B|nr:nucleotidyltransferase domain-containing protein [Halorussus vallis]USZ78278.1 nucleotidyltransferase domain-containing protein [Halorussus vallis]